VILTLFVIVFPLLIQAKMWDMNLLRKITRRSPNEQIVRAFVSITIFLLFLITISRTIRRERIISNARIFDIEITLKDMQVIDRLDNNEHIGADSENFNC